MTLFDSTYKIVEDLNESKQAWPIWANQSVAQDQPTQLSYLERCYSSYTCQSGSYGSYS